VSECDDQLRHVCGWNRRLSRENTVLRLKLRGLEQRLAGLERTNVDLLVERDATDHLLGVAMDDRLGGGGVLV
jgi:hypothetical protein